MDDKPGARDIAVMTLGYRDNAYQDAQPTRSSHALLPNESQAIAECLISLKHQSQVASTIQASCWPGRLRDHARSFTSCAYPCNRPEFSFERAGRADNRKRKSSQAIAALDE